ncbi:unnamed protein product, partial [Iphiclides podalirius]
MLISEREANFGGWNQFQVKREQCDRSGERNRNPARISNRFYRAVIGGSARAICAPHARWRAADSCARAPPGDV